MIAVCAAVLQARQTEPSDRATNARYAGEDVPHTLIVDPFYACQ